MGDGDGGSVGDSGWWITWYVNWTWGLLAPRYWTSPDRFSPNCSVFLDSGPEADCNQQTSRTTLHHVYVLNLASVRFPTQDQQSGTPYLAIYE